MTVFTQVRIGANTAGDPRIPHGPTIMAPLSGASTGRVLTQGSFGTSAGWPQADLAIFFPVDMVETFLVVKAFAAFGPTPAGNIDWGLYDETGAKLASTGSTAVTAVSDLQVADLSYNITQRRIYFAMAADSTSVTLYRTNTFSGIEQAVLGVRQMATAFPLPPTATFADVAFAYLPVAGISKRSLI